MKLIKTELEIDSAWNAAVNETLLARMESKFPDYHKLKEDQIPIELQVERKRMRRNLISDISKAIWRKHPNWVKVQNNFEKLKKHYTLVIEKLAIPETLRQDWLERIGSVALVAPGSMPEISDTECATTKNNAYYYPTLNVLTVCAGDFNSEDILLTIAHELGHALDIDRSFYLAQMKSSMGQSVRDLREQVCHPATFSCEHWSNFKSDFSKNLASLSKFKPELPDFQACLQTREPQAEITSDDLDRIADRVVTDKISDLASSEVFLRITKERIPLSSKADQKNPNYLNPCEYYLWTLGEEPLDDNMTTLFFFTAEYQCTPGDSISRLKHAIEVSKQMSTQLVRQLLAMEGEFSSRAAMEIEGFSSSPSERFSDVLGSYAMASLLNEMPREWDRRNTFLASSSWQCSKPSLASRFPAESSVQRAYVYDSHTDGEDRKNEYFSGPIQEVIGCKKDFKFDSCEIEFKK